MPDLIREAGLDRLAVSVRHGESRALAEELQRLARETASVAVPAWPPKERLTRWTEAAVVAKIVALVENPRTKDN